MAPKRIVCLLVLMTTMLLGPVATARANRANATGPQVISTQYPLPPYGTEGACGSIRRLQNWEQEPSLGVNPTNGRNLVTAWIQDWADAIVVASSFDGGGTWTNVVPRTTLCTGGLGSYNSALDPSLSFGPSFGPNTQGVGYLLSVLQDASGTHGPGGTPAGTAAVVNRSLDGGRSWSDPIALDKANFPLAIDGSFLLADPVHAGYAYAMWMKGDNILSRVQYISRTTDAGEHWSTPAPIVSDMLQFGSHVMFLPPDVSHPNGTLVDVFGEVPPQPSAPFFGVQGPTKLLATRSRDLGMTWSVPTRIADADAKFASAPGAAAASDGSAIYAAWQRVDPSETKFSLMYSKSPDGGLSWSDARPIAADLPGTPSLGAHASVLAMPNLAVAADGTVGVAFYDHRNDRDVSAAPLVTDLWFSHSHDGGSSWAETHVAGPFDQTTAPSAEDGRIGTPVGFLGDFQGIAATADGFALSFSLAAPLPDANFALTNPPTDMFFARVRLVTATKQPR